MFLCVLFDVLSLLSCNDIWFVPLLARKYSKYCPPTPPAHHRSRRRSQNADSSLAKRSQRREAIKDGFIRRLSRCGTKYVGGFAYRLYFAPCTAAGLAQSVGRLTAEEEVAGFYSWDKDFKLLRNEGTDFAL